jgi:hypothetical protein
MSQQENRIADSQFLDWGEAAAGADELDIGGLGAARSPAVDDAGSSIVRQLNGSLTALLLYMEELKQHSHRLSRETGERDHLQKVVENALQQTERVCALVKQAGGAPMAALPTMPARNGMLQGRAERPKESTKENARCPAALLSPSGRGHAKAWCAKHRRPCPRRPAAAARIASPGAAGIAKRPPAA